MIKWYRQPESVDKVTEIINYIFTVIFLAEAAIRIIGIGIQNYLKDGWNIFDCVVATGSVVSILISSSTTVEIKAVTLLRAFRILRLLRLLKRGGKSLYLIFNTFVITMQSLANIGGLLLLMMYIYSIIGMIYFGEVKRNSSMSDYINFETFSSAFITLFTVATVDSWNYTMISFSYVLSPSN
jgi:voltage-dependent calcium channel T type alpha-1H